MLIIIIKLNLLIISKLWYLTSLSIILVVNFKETRVKKNSNSQLEKLASVNLLLLLEDSNF